MIDTLSNPGVYDKFLHVLSNRKGEVPSEQTELHQTPPPVTSNSDQEVPPTVSSGYSADQSKFSIDSALIGLDMWKQHKRVTLPVFLGDKRMHQN